MFKKGFKALKSLGKKTSKKKDKGDGDTTSQAEEEGEGAAGLSQGARARSTTPQPRLTGIAAKVGKSPRSAANQGAPSQPPSYSALDAQKQLPQGRLSASTSQTSLSKGATSDQPAVSREKSAEESVLAMLQDLKAAKEAEKRQDPKPFSKFRSSILSDTDPWPEEDNSSFSSLFSPPDVKDLAQSDSSEGEDDEDDSSSESELTFQKKQREKNEKEERKKKGLSVSSSASDDSWGDTSDILPVDKNATTSKASDASPTVAATTLSSSPNRSSILAPANKSIMSQFKFWRDKVKKEGSKASLFKGKIKATTNIKVKIEAPPTAAGEANKPAAAAAASEVLDSDSDSWGDTDDEVSADPPKTVVQTPAAALVTGVLSEPTSQLSDSEVDEPDVKSQVPISAAATPKPSPDNDNAANSTSIIKPKELEIDIQSDSGSDWSDDDMNDTKRSNADNAVPLAKEPVVEQHQMSSTYSIAPGNTTVGNFDIGLSRDEPSSKPAAIVRQQSEESKWSDEEDDGIEMLAAPQSGGQVVSGDQLLAVGGQVMGSDQVAGSGQVTNSGQSAKIQAVEEQVVPSLSLQLQSPPVSSKSVSSAENYGLEPKQDQADNTGNTKVIAEVTAELTSKLSAAESVQTSLQHDNEILKRELSEIKDEKDQLNETIQRLEKEAKELRSHTEKYDDVTKKLKVIMDENERLGEEQNSNMKLKEEMEKLKDELERTKTEKSEMEGDQGKENSNLRQAISDWQIKYSQLEQVSQQHQQACQELETEMKNLQENLQDLEFQKSALETEKNMTLKELEVLKGELKDKSGFEVLKRDMEDMTREHKAKAEKLSRELALNKDAHDEELQRVELIHKQEVEQLNAANERKSQLAETRVATLNQQIASLQSDNKDLQNRCSKLRTEQSEKSKASVPQSDYIEQQKENELLQKKIRELEKMLRQEQLPLVAEQDSTLSNGVVLDGELESRSRDIQLRRERAERELQEARERLRLRHNSTGSLSSASSDLSPRQRLSARNQQLPTYATSSDDDDSRHDRYNGHSSMLEINSGGVQQKEMERKEEKIKQLVSENAGLQKTVARLQSETRTLSNQLQATQEETDDLKVQTDKLREKLNIRDQEVTMELNKKLEGELNADAQHGKLKQQIVLLESQIVRLRETNSQLELKLKNVSAELGTKESLLKSQAEGSTHLASSAMLDSELVQVRTELAQVRSSLNSERATFMAALDEKDKEIAAETSEKESAKAALDEVTKSLMYLQEEMSTSYTPLSVHQEALNKAAEQEDKLRRDLIGLRGSLDSYSKEAIEAKNVCSMQQILVNEKDRELKDKDRDIRSLRRELDSKIEALSNVNAQLQQSGRDRDKDRDRLREEMLAMTRSLDPNSATINYKTMYDELRVDREREKAMMDQLVERLKWEISTVEERLEKAKAELQDKVKLETNYLLAQGEAERFKQEASELIRKVTKLEGRVEQQQRDSDHLKESRHEIGANNQTLKDENSRLRENNSELKAELNSLQREMSNYNVTKEEMETALATAKLTTDVNDLSRQENDTEMQLERKHKMVLYRQAKSLKSEVNDKNIRLQELEKQTEKLSNKVTKLKMENNTLQARIKERGAVEARLSWDAASGLTQSDLFQQEVRQLQSQLNSTTTDMQAQARKAKARKYDLNYYQTKAEELEKQNLLLSSKLNDSVRMIEVAERTAADLRSHITELNNRLLQLEQLESSTDMTLQELRLSQDEKSRSLQNKNRELERDLRQLKNKLSMAETELASTERLKSSESILNGTLPRSRSSSPPRYMKSIDRSRGSPTTEYEKDRRALTRAAWAVLDDHGLGPSPEQRVFENLDRIWRRNASRPARRL